MKFSHALAQAIRQRESVEEQLKAGITQMVEQAKPLPNKRFNELALVLRTEMAKRGNRNSSVGIDEFVRVSVTGEQSIKSIPVHTYEEVVRFTRTYRHKKGQVCKLLEGVDTGRGDDSHGDLCDAFPLLGEEWLEKLRLISSDDSTWKLVDREAKDKLQADVYKLVFEGENYIASRLEEHLMQFAKSALRDGEVIDPQPRLFELTTMHPQSQQFAYKAKVRALDEKEALRKFREALSQPSNLVISMHPDNSDIVFFELHSQPHNIGKEDIIGEVGNE